MFGYVIPDKPNMFMKDYTAYRAYYCGICKSIGKKYGQLLRFSTNYDITFLNVLMHSVEDCSPVYANEACVLNPLKKKLIAKDDEITRKIIDVNMMLAHYKLQDNIADEGGIFKRIAARLVLRRHYLKAKKSFPEIDRMMEESFAETDRLEKAGCASVDQIADPFASLLKGVVRALSGERYTEALGDMMYHMGKWIYVMDAIDDLEDDQKSGSYNPFLVVKKFEDKQQFFDEKQGDLEFLLMSAYHEMKRNFAMIETKVAEGVLTNILWYGILDRTERVLRREQSCKKVRI